MISKNNMGIVFTLLLIIILSQSRFFHFLLDNALGRSILIMCILGISYINKILGVVSVLFIVVMFSQSNMDYLNMNMMEGFDTTGATTNNMATKLTKPPILANDEIQKVKNNALIQSNIIKEPIKKEPFINSSREGFNIIDREGSILKGKRSNQVPVYSSANTQGDFGPAEESVFSGSYTQV